MLAFAPIDGAAGVAHDAVTALADLVAPVAGSAATAVAIVLFTMIVRLLLSPLSLAQVRGQRRQADLAPTLREIQRRHRDAPARMSTELAAAYRATGTTPLAGCLPALLQAPFFLVMFRLVAAPTMDGDGNALLGETLFGVPLGHQLADGLGGAAGPLFFLLFAALGLTAWLTSRRMRRSAPGANVQDGGTNTSASLVGRVLPLLPFTVLPAAAVLPLAACLYLATTTAWSVAEQGILRRVVTVL